MLQTFLTIDQFKVMDYKAINSYSLPIELMMENAGLHLARMITRHASPESLILVGVGTGNNGGGGLVAARRLSGWGYRVNLDIPDPNLKKLASVQLKRAISFGAVIKSIDNPDIFADAFFGFSQRIPLPEIFLQALNKPGISNAFTISLDIPSGFDKNTMDSLFNPNCILTMAAPKSELLQSDLESDIFVADIGIPRPLYNDLGIEQPNFGKSGILKYPYK